MNNPSAINSAAQQLSRHELYLLNLSTSGKPLPELAAAWHSYYAQLSEIDKAAIWKEYHQTNQFTGLLGPQPVVPPPLPLHIAEPVADNLNAHPARRRLRSLAFGILSAAVVTGIFLFGLFNEVVISPFIQPSQTTSAVPLIVNSASAAADPTPRVLIPKINVEIPVDYTLASTSDAAFQKALDKGVVHYPGTAQPGEKGNAAFFGHSSNNIFNSGKYKFAFVLLHKLVERDVFYLTHDKKTYAYEVISRRVVRPSEVSVLGPVAGEESTATLITCDPPGTSTNRLVVVGRQISPDPAGNVAPPAAKPKSNIQTTQALPSNGPSAWAQWWNSIF